MGHPHPRYPVSGGGSSCVHPTLRKMREGWGTRALCVSPATALYLIPMTMESGPTRCSTRVLVKPASFIQPMQSAPV